MTCKRRTNYVRTYAQIQQASDLPLTQLEQRAPYSRDEGHLGRLAPQSSYESREYAQHNSTLRQLKY